MAKMRTLGKTSFQDVCISSARDLERVSRALRKLEYPQSRRITLKLPKLAKSYVENRLESIKKNLSDDGVASDFIYVIRLKQNQRHIIADLRSRLGAAKARNKRRKDERQSFHAYPDNSATHTDTDTLYVGRSKSPITRLTQHLGRKTGGSSTHALYMQTWATRVDAEVIISYIRLDGLSHDVVQAVEDGIWQFLRPAFGKKGAQ